MDNFENKIKKIRSTIDEIRSDIEAMKSKNEKTLTHMAQSISNLSSNQNCNQREEKINIDIIPGQGRGYYGQKAQNPNGQLLLPSRTPVDINTGADTSLDQIEENIVRRYERLNKNPPECEHRAKEIGTIAGSETDTNVNNNQIKESSACQFHEDNMSRKSSNINNNYFQDYLSSIPVKPYSKTPEIKYSRQKSNQEKDSISDFENPPSRNRQFNMMKNNQENSDTNYNFNYNTVQREELKNIFHKSNNHTPIRDKIPDVNTLTPPISNNLQTNTNSENLEKQIINLQSVVTGLQKKNAFLQREIKSERTKDYETDTSQTAGEEKSHVRNYSSSGKQNNQNPSSCNEKTNIGSRYNYNPSNSQHKFADGELRGLQSSNSSSSSVPYPTQRERIATYEKSKITENRLTSRYDNNNEDQMKDNIFPDINTKKFRGYNYERIVNEMLKIANSSGTELITPEILVEHYRSSICQLKSAKLKDEFVEKLSDLYQALSGIENENENENVKGKEQTDIKTLWRWIKGMIHRMKDGTTSDDSISGKNNTSKIPRHPASNRTTNEDAYKEFCENIIKNYYLKDINELKFFVNQLLSKSLTNSKRVEKIKRLLLAEPQNGSRYSITNDSASVSNRGQN